MLPAIFISYNPDSEVEQTLALRLHTIGSVHGFNMILPDRSFSSTVVSTEARGRILSSDFFIVFSTDTLSHVVKEEISIAFSKHHDKSKILVIYDMAKGKNVTGLDQCTEVYVDTKQDALTIVNGIAKRIQLVNPKTGSEFLSVLSGILLVGVGLFALSEIFVDPVKSKKKSVVKRRKKVNA